MAPEPTDRLSVSLQKLQETENEWKDIGLKLTNASVKARNNVNLNPAELGLFARLNDSYKNVGPFAADRLSEGVKACGAIAGVLKVGRETYRQREQDSVDQFNGLN